MVGHEKMKIYISGPITGMPNDNREAFTKAESFLRSEGLEPVNPFTFPHDHDKTWASFMREDIRELTKCQMIYMLAGWEKSRGARIEFRLAQDLDMTTLYGDPS
jgi:nucleoside 2-deoxyribosyltransferase